MIPVIVTSAVQGSTASTCSDLQGYYRSMTCCGNPDQAVSCTDKTSPPVTMEDIAFMVPDCDKELAADACGSKSFSSFNYGSFECDATGESLCDASNFRSSNPLTAIAGYSTPMAASQQSGLMWARSVVHDGHFLFAQQSRTGFFGAQYGPTNGRGRVQKISKASGEVVASIDIDGRWAPTIAKAADGKKYVFVVHSHFLAHGDMNGVFPGTSNPPAYSSVPVGRIGHWIFKLDYDTLAIVAKREVSVDHDIVEPRVSKTARDATDFSDPASIASYLPNVVGTTQLNGFIASYEEDTLCPGGELLFTGISGYPYYYAFSDEPQSRPIGMYNQRNTGRGQAYCSNDLLPKWANPASNGYMKVPDVDEANGNPSAADYLGAGKKRHLIVGDKIPAAKIRPGQSVTVVASNFDCSGGASGSNTYALDTLLAKEYTLGLAAPLANPLAVDDAVAVGAVQFIVTKAAAAGATEVEVRIKGADYRPFPAGADFKVFNSATSAYDTVTTITGTNKALIEVPYVGTATPKDATGTRWSSQAAYHEQLVTVAGDGTVAVDRSVVCAPVNIILNVSSSSAPSGYVLYDDAVVRPNYPNFPPQIKTKKAAGAIIASDGERVSLQQFGGSWWFRAAAANGKLVTPQGNGHMESIDRYQVFRDFYLRRDVVHNKISQLAKAINDPALRATLGVVSDEDHKAAFLAALAERHAMIDERRALFQSLSEVDYAGVESAVAAYDIQTGNRIWVTSGEAPDVSFTPAPLTTPLITLLTPHQPHDAGLERRRGDACLRHAVSAHQPGDRRLRPHRRVRLLVPPRRGGQQCHRGRRQGALHDQGRSGWHARRNDWCAAPREHDVDLVRQGRGRVRGAQLRRCLLRR